MASSNDYSSMQNYFASHLQAYRPIRSVWESQDHSLFLWAIAEPLHLTNSCLLLRRAFDLDFRNQMSFYLYLTLVGQKVAFDSHSVVSALCVFLTSFCSYQQSSWLVYVQELLLQLHLDLLYLKYYFFARPHHEFYEILIHLDYHCSTDLELLSLHDLQATSYSSTYHW